MVSAASIVLDRISAGVADRSEVDAVPAYQWRVYFDELSPHCPSSLPVVPRSQRNALRIEILPSRDARCSRRSPDGRGLAWLMSGGDPLSYGLCALDACPRVKGEK